MGTERLVSIPLWFFPNEKKKELSKNEVLAALKSILDVRDFERKRKHERD